MTADNIEETTGGENPEEFVAEITTGLENKERALLPNELTQEEEERALEVGGKIYDSIKTVKDSMPKEETLTALVFRVAENDIVYQIEEGDEYISLDTGLYRGSRDNDGMSGISRCQDKPVSKEEEELAYNLTRTHIDVGHSREVFRVDQFGVDKRTGKMASKVYLDAGLQGIIPPSDDRYVKAVNAAGAQGVYEKQKGKMFSKLDYIEGALNSGNASVIIERPLKVK